MTTEHPTKPELLMALGQRLLRARRRRHWERETVAERANMTLETLSAIERGDPSVPVGAYLNVLSFLDLANDIGLVATDEALLKERDGFGLDSYE